MEPATKTPLLHHKLEQILDGRGPDPRLARLQGGRRAVRVLPEGRAVPGVHRRSCAGSSWACCSWRSTAASACSCAATSTGAASRSWSRCPATGSTPRCASACSSCSWSGSTGRRSTTTSSLGETEIARIFFTVHVDPGVQIPEVPYEELEAEVERLARTWDDDLRDALVARVGPERGSALAEKYAARFPSYYKASRRVGPDRRRRARRWKRWSRTRRASWSGSGTRPSGERLTRVKLYKTGGKVDLSAFMPILEALGLRVVEEIPTAVARRGQGLHPRLRRARRARRGARPRARRPSTSRTRSRAVWRGQAESDSLEPARDRRAG